MAVATPAPARDPAHRLWTTPNLLSLFRIALVPVLVWILRDPGPLAGALAAALFILGSLSDYYDGYLARKHGIVTTLGKFLDPLADKLLVVSVLIMLVAMPAAPVAGVPSPPRVPAWLVVVIVGRELAVTGLRSIASSEGITLGAEELGKYKTIFQIFALTGLLVHYRYFFMVLNTLNLGAVARDRVPTLSLHETVPGHHLQIALVFEMKDGLSEYRRKIFSSTAFVEGWALYAEWLGREMGVYRTPMQRVGNLNDEMLRAVRLVVDTGIHAYGWSRQRARAYMHEHLAHDPEDIAIEVDRYAVWPGQALAYKLGELEIRALRRRAEAALGAAFDVREFHDVVLGDGTVSLGVLRSQVDAWLTAKLRGARR